jgi:hypothetical protein
MLAEARFGEFDHVFVARENGAVDKIVAVGKRVRNRQAKTSREIPLVVLTLA